MRGKDLVAAILLQLRSPPWAVRPTVFQPLADQTGSVAILVNDAYQLSVIWPANPRTSSVSAAFFFHAEIYERPFVKMRANSMGFLDSLGLGLAERTSGMEQVVTWNARHFHGKCTLSVLTYEAYLRASAPSLPADV